MQDRSHPFGWDLDWSGLPCVDPLTKTYKGEMTMLELQVDNRHFGQLVLNEDGKPVCHICGKAFDKLLSHVFISHGYKAREYKWMFGLDMNKGIISDKTRSKLREAVEAHFDNVVVQTLLQNNKATQFKKGNKAHTRSNLSEMHRRRLTLRLNHEGESPVVKLTGRVQHDNG